jgi:hypothetical protein
MAHAAIIVPTGVTYTGTAPDIGGSGLNDPNGIINGSGLSEALTDANLATVTHAAVGFNGNAWTTTDPGGFPSDFFAATTGTVVFEFDLGSTTPVGTFASWGYHFGAFNGNSISDVTLDFSTDGGTTIDSSQTITVPFGATFDASTIVPLTPTTANFITMTVNDNHYDPANEAAGGDRVGLAEIAFSTEVIPEPATLSLMGVLGAVALLSRRKRAA